VFSATNIRVQTYQKRYQAATATATATIGHLGRALEPPSPYRTTHVLVAQPITLIRRGEDQPSFGVNLQAVTTSILVDPPRPVMATKIQMADETSTPESLEKTTANLGPPATETTPPLEPVPLGAVASNKSRRPRRRRINFTVMMGMDAEKQNRRWNEPQTSRTRLLPPPVGATSRFTLGQLVRTDF
jgi:hypothetical protein